MVGHDHTFSDDARTGQFSPGYRGLRRATLAASVRDGSDLEWVLKFRRDFLPDVNELKSDLVLAIMESKPEAAPLVLKGVSPSSIVIVDFSAYTDVVISELLKKLAPGMLPSLDHAKALRMLEVPGELAEEILRSARVHAIQTSTIPRIEWLLTRACSDADIVFSQGATLFDQNALLEMNEREFSELVARFAIALGDALDPKNQAEAIKRVIVSSGHLSDSHIAGVSLSISAGTDRTFDEGTQGVFDKLRDAHSTILSFLREIQYDYMIETLRGGVLRQEDSSKVLGLQVADIAVGVALREFQRGNPETREGAIQVKRVFDRVLLNDEWL